MTSRRLRKQRRENSVAGLLGRIREQDWARQGDAASWRANGNHSSPWDYVLRREARQERERESPDASA